MDRVITLLVCCCVFLFGGLAFDRMPPVRWDVPIPFVPDVRFDSLKAQRDAAIVAGKQGTENLRQCRINAGNLQAAIDEQNRAVEALKADSDARLARSWMALSDAQHATLSAKAASDYIKAHPPVGADICVRMLSTDETFLKALQ
jgi:hypothetical protein